MPLVHGRKWQAEYSILVKNQHSKKSFKFISPFTTCWKFNLIIKNGVKNDSDKLLKSLSCQVEWFYIFLSTSK